MVVGRVVFDAKNHLVEGMCLAVAIEADSGTVALASKSIPGSLFILEARSLGRTEDKTIKTIKIPPVNNIRKIIGNQVVEVRMHSNMKVVDLINISIIVTLTGFADFIAPIRAKDQATVARVVIIFFSLYKASILDIEESRKIFKCLTKWMVSIFFSF